MQQLNIKFVSMLAQAQRAIGTNSIDRYVGSLGAVAQFKPDVLDKFDSDAWADAYAEMLGVDPTMIVPSKDAALVRDNRAQMQARPSSLRCRTRPPTPPRSWRRCPPRAARATRRTTS